MRLRQLGDDLVRQFPDERLGGVVNPLDELSPPVAEPSPLMPHVCVCTARREVEDLAPHGRLVEPFHVDAVDDGRADLVLLENLVGLDEAHDVLGQRLEVRARDVVEVVGVLVDLPVAPDHVQVELVVQLLLRRRERERHPLQDAVGREPEVVAVRVPRHDDAAAVALDANQDDGLRLPGDLWVAAGQGVLQVQLGGVRERLDGGPDAVRAELVEHAPDDVEQQAVPGFEPVGAGHPLRLGQLQGSGAYFARRFVWHA